MSDTPNTPDPAPQPVPPAPTPVPTPVQGTPLPPPLPQAAATPRNRARTGTVIGVVVGVVAGGGAIAGLLNMVGGDDAQASEPTVLDVAPPPPTAPAVADAGTVDAPITLPGPAVQPPVTTAAPTTTAPAAPDTTTAGGGLQPPDSGPADDPAASGSVQLAEGISFGVPDGWEILASQDTYAAIGNGSAMVFVNVYEQATSASDLLFGYQSVIADDLAGIEFGEIGTSEIYSNLVVDAAAFSYRGYMGQGQSGSTVVDGTVFADVRYDGVGIITDVMWVPLGEGSISDSDRADLNVVFESFVYGE